MNKNTLYPLAARKRTSRNTQITVGGVIIGSKKIVVVAGPCAIENRMQFLKSARFVKKAGARIVRGMVYKPRTSPYSFQGLEENGFKFLAEVRKKIKLPIVTEVVNVQDISKVLSYTDILQIGARNMQNFSLLKEVGRTKHPVLLKRGFCAKIDELLLAAEYILNEGNPNVILCERGIRTFETSTRNTLDLNAVPVLKQLTHLPIFVDPSHGTGNRGIVSTMAKAAIASGADGLIIEVHPQPANALSDGPQSLNFQQFETLMKEIRPVARAVGRTV